MATVYLALGSNLGKRENYIQRAIEELTTIGLTIDRVSKIIETEPMGGPPQGKFLNAVLKAKTDFTPTELLYHLQAIEKKIGRKEKILNGPRVIDIDILLYDKLKINSDELTIPHPRMKQREFVMRPLQEIAPEIIKEII